MASFISVLLGTMYLYYFSLFDESLADIEKPLSHYFTSDFIMDKAQGWIYHVLKNCSFGEIF